MKKTAALKKKRARRCVSSGLYSLVVGFFAPAGNEPTVLVDTFRNQHTGNRPVMAEITHKL